MIIRKFKASDAVAAARMHRWTIRKINSKDYSTKQIKIWSGRTNAKRFRDSMKSKISFVAVDDGKIVGFGGFKKDGEFGSLYVHNKYIGGGVGKKLLKKMEKTAANMGIKKFTINSSLTAKNFYQSQGYNVIRKTVFSRPGLNLQVYKMEKSLRDIILTI